MTDKKELYKQIPQVDKLLHNEILKNREFYRHEIIDAVKIVLDELRNDIKDGKIVNIPADDELALNALDLAFKRVDKDIRRVINATGVILHSNLGRACLSKAASEAIAETISSYCTLEYDINEGKRGDRTGGVEKYLKNITDCEASLIVNNNAAAVLLVLSAITAGGNVIVSRGELVEIGGGFRVPDIIMQCGCELREVGTTNKTRIDDYSSATDKNTKALLKVHSSNFKVVGFTESVSVSELAGLSKTHNIPLIEDIGSGALSDVRRYSLYEEPIVKESLQNGADIVTFSGDKLLGSLQCGIILGKKEYIDLMKKHPLYRAFRIDKVTIAALEATLRVYGDLQTAQRDIPVLRMLSFTEDELRSKAEKLCEEIRKHGVSVDVIKTKSVAGGGSVPGLELPSYAISPIGSGSTDETEKYLRKQKVPIIGRIENDRLLLDLRTIFDEDHEYIINTVASLIS